MTTKQEKMYDVLVELTTEQAIGALLDWHGDQLLDDGFMQHLINEGYTDDDDDDDWNHNFDPTESDIQEMKEW